MRHHEVKICPVLLGHMVVLANCSKGKGIPPWHNIPKFDEFLQVVFTLNVLTRA
jgi:hypothetical protein